jgi:hypothetical protein
VIAAKVQLLRWRLAGGEGSDAETRFERKNISVKGARRRGRGGLIAPVHVVASKIASISPFDAAPSADAAAHGSCDNLPPANPCRNFAMAMPRRSLARALTFASNQNASSCD